MLSDSEGSGTAGRCSSEDGVHSAEFLSPATQASCSSHRRSQASCSSHGRSQASCSSHRRSQASCSSHKRSQASWSSNRGDLAGVLSGSHQAGLRVSGSHQAGSRVSGSNLAGSHISGSQLSGLHLSGSQLSGLRMIDSQLNGSHLSGSRVNGSQLSSSQLSSRCGSNRSDSHMNCSHLGDLNTFGSRQNLSQLSSSHLSVQKRSNSHLGGSQVGDYHTNDSQLNNSHMRKSKVGWSNLNRPHLCNAYLSGSHPCSSHNIMSDSHRLASQQSNPRINGFHMSGAHPSHSQWSRSQLSDSRPSESHESLSHLSSSRVGGVLLSDPNDLHRDCMEYNTRSPHSQISQQNVNNAKGSLLSTNKTCEHSRNDVTYLAATKTKIAFRGIAGACPMTRETNFVTSEPQRHDSDLQVKQNHRPAINTTTAVIDSWSDHESDTYSSVEDIPEILNGNAIGNNISCHFGICSPPKLKTKSSFVGKKNMPLRKEQQSLQSFNNQDSTQKESFNNRDITQAENELLSKFKYDDSWYNLKSSSKSMISSCLLDRGEGATLVKSSANKHPCYGVHNTDNLLETISFEPKETDFQNKTNLSSTNTGYRITKNKGLMCHKRRQIPNLDESHYTSSLQGKSKTSNVYSGYANSDYKPVQATTIGLEEQQNNVLKGQIHAWLYQHPMFQNTYRPPTSTLTPYSASESCSPEAPSWVTFDRTHRDNTTQVCDHSYDVTSGVADRDTYVSSRLTNGSLLDLKKSPKMNSGIQKDLGSSYHKINLNNLPIEVVANQCKRKIPSQCNKGTTSLEEFLKDQEIDSYLSKTNTDTAFKTTERLRQKHRALQSTAQPPSLRTHPGVQEWDKLFIPVLRTPIVSSTKNSPRLHTQPRHRVLGETVSGASLTPFVCNKKPSAFPCQESASSVEFKRSDKHDAKPRKILRKKRKVSEKKTLQEARLVYSSEFASHDVSDKNKTNEFITKTSSTEISSDPFDDEIRPLPQSRKEQDGYFEEIRSLSEMKSTKLLSDNLHIIYNAFMEIPIKLIKRNIILIRETFLNSPIINRYLDILGNLKTSLRGIIEKIIFLIIGMFVILFLFKVLATFTGGVYISPLFTLKPIEHQHEQQKGP